MLLASVEQIIQYVNYGLLAIIILCALIGFIRGTLKSGYYFLTTIISLIIGLLFLGPISNTLLNVNIAKFNIVINGIQIETPMQFLTDYINKNYTNYQFLLQENSYSLELLQGVVKLVFSLICYVLLLIAMVTIFYLIFGIIWKIFKKTFRKIFNKKQESGSKYHISFLSRLGGLGIGATKGLIYLLLVGIIFAGVSSIVTSTKNIINESSEVAVIFAEDTYTIVELNVEEEKTDSKEQNQLLDPELEKILNAYHETISGKIYGSMKIGKNKLSIDEALFDSIFNIKGKNGSIKLCNELKTLEQAFSTDAVKKIMSDGFDIKKLYLLSNEELNDFIKIISSLDCINVLVPVGLEFITYSDVLEDKLGNEYEDIKQLLSENLPELIEMDYCQEIKNLGYVFVNIIDLLGDGLENPSEIDYFNLNQEIIEKLFVNLEKLEIFEIVAPITINYLLNSETVIKAIKKFGFTVEDLGLSNDIDYVSEFRKIPELYKKFIALGIKQVEGEIDLSDINVDAIDGFTEALFDSTIISNAIPIVASTLTINYLPTQYSDLFTKEELESAKWEEEFSPLLKAVAILLNTNILAAEDKVEAICSLSTEDIDKLGTYLAGSDLVVNKLNYIMENIMKTFINEKIDYLGLDNTEEEKWDKKEIIAMFNVMKQFADGFKYKFNDDEIEMLADNIGKSKYIKKNLNNIVNALTNSFGFNVANLSDDEWTINEIYVTFKAINIVTSSSSGNVVSLESFLNVSDEDQNILFESKIIRNSLKKLLIEKSKDGEVLQRLKGVYENGIDETGKNVYDWNDLIVDAKCSVENNRLIITPYAGAIKYNIYKNDHYYKSITETKLMLNDYDFSDEYSVKAIVSYGELRNILSAISKLNIENINNFNIDLKAIIENKDDIFASYIFSQTIIQEIINLANAESPIIYIPNIYKDNKASEWNGRNGELYNLLDAIDILLDITSSEKQLNIDELNEKMEFLYLNKLSNNLDMVLKSDIISLTLINKFRKLNNQGLNVTEKYMTNDSLWLSEYQNGELINHQELGRLINSLVLIVGENDRLESLDVHKAVDETLELFIDDEYVRKVLDSEIICETIKNYIVNCNVFEGNDYITNAFKNNNKNINDNNEWYAYDGNHNPIKKELWAMLEGISLIIGDASFSELDSINIELLIANNDLKPKFDNQYNSIDSKINIILESIVIEEIFVDVVKKMCEDTGYLANVINIPSDVNWYRKDVKGSKEYDLQTFIESFLIIQEYIGYGVNDNIINSFTKLNNLSDKEIDELATGMVTSRIFRGSIEKIFNTIFYPQYVLKSLSSSTIKLWDSIKFNQSDYENNTKVDAHDKFVSAFKKMCEELNK